MWLCWGLWMEIILEVRFITLSNYANINFCLKQRWSIFFKPTGNTGPTVLPDRSSWEFCSGM